MVNKKILFIILIIFNIKIRNINSLYILPKFYNNFKYNQIDILKQAIESNDIKNIKRIIYNNINILNTKDELNQNILFWIPKYNTYLIKFLIELFIKNRIDINALNKYNQNVLFNIYPIICKNNIYKEKYINNNIFENNKEENILESFKILIDKNIDVNQLDLNNENALFKIVNNRLIRNKLRLKLVKILIDKNIDINIANKSYKQNVLFNAIENKNIKLIKLLINKNIEINQVDINEENIIFYLIKNNKIEYKTKLKILKKLIDNNININQINIHNENVLYYDIREETNIIKLLIDNKINIEHINNQKENCLFNLVRNNDLENIKLLIKRGININQQNSKNKNVLFYAIKNNINYDETSKEFYTNIKIIKLLINKGTKIDIVQILDLINKKPQISDKIVIFIILLYFINSYIENNDYEINILEEYFDKEFNNNDNNINSNKNINEDDSNNYEKAINKMIELISKNKSNNIINHINIDINNQTLINIFLETLTAKKFFNYIVNFNNYNEIKNIIFIIKDNIKYKKKKTDIIY